MWQSIIFFFLKSYVSTGKFKHLTPLYTERPSYYAKRGELCDSFLRWHVLIFKKKKKIIYYSTSIFTRLRIINLVIPLDILSMTFLLHVVTDRRFWNLPVIKSQINHFYCFLRQTLASLSQLPAEDLSFKQATPSFDSIQSMRSVFKP